MLPSVAELSYKILTMKHITNILYILNNKLYKIRQFTTDNSVLEMNRQDIDVPVFILTFFYYPIDNQFKGYSFKYKHLIHTYILPMASEISAQNTFTILFNFSNAKTCNDKFQPIKGKQLN